MCLLKHTIWRLTDIQTHVHLQVSVLVKEKDKPDNELKQCTNKSIPVHITDNELNKIIHTCITKHTSQNSFVYIINVKCLTPCDIISIYSDVYGKHVYIYC